MWYNNIFRNKESKDLDGLKGMVGDIIDYDEIKKCITEINNTRKDPYITELEIQENINKSKREQEDKRQAQIDELLNPFKVKVDKYLEDGFQIEKLELMDTWTELEVIRFNERFTIKDISVEHDYPNIKLTLGGVIEPISINYEDCFGEDDNMVMYNTISCIFHYIKSKFKAEQSKIQKLENEVIRESLLKELTK